MSISHTWVMSEDNVAQVMHLYCQDAARMTLTEIADRLGTRYANVQHVVAKNLTPEQMYEQKAVRYARSKLGDANPMRHKSGSLHHNYKGDVGDGYGYLQRKIGDQYHFVHRLVMEEVLGLPVGGLASSIAVHHVDGDKQNNAPNNLAALNHSAHTRLHAKQAGKRLR